MAPRSKFCEGSARDLSVRRDPVQAFVTVSYAKFNIEVSALFCRLRRRMNFWNVVEKHRFFPAVEVGQSKDGSCLRSPVPGVVVVIIFKGCDSAGNLTKPKPLL